MAGYKNYEVKRNKNTKSVGAFDQTRNYNKSDQKITKSEKLMEGCRGMVLLLSLSTRYFCGGVPWNFFKTFSKNIIICNGSL